jgi:LmbE family N-acetylglucosaminyl deacetylase
MTVSVDLPVPRRALAVGAHPDDIEFGCGGTLSKWADAGTLVTVCICTDGAKGTWEPDADLAALIGRRETEQRDAASILGAVGVEFLRFVDGELHDTLAARAAVCAVIRRAQPDVILAHDPWQRYRVHPDHHEAGRIAIGGIVAARDPHFFPELGLPTHRPSVLLGFEPERVHHVEDVREHVDRKIAALLAHRSQWRSTMGIDRDVEAEETAFRRRLHDEARAAALHAGLRAAEAFSRIDKL